MIIFTIVTLICGFMPFGDTPLNPFDATHQYPAFNLEFMRSLLNGNVFYSWSAGLGFNLFGSASYYSFSPLNLLTIFASPQNYDLFIAIMTIFRFGLLGFTMSIYLSRTIEKPSHIVLFSTIYSLMGYASTYFYNHMWIDAIIMLPIVVYGLDDLIEGKSPLLYTISLTATIIVNYYIGYMICIFCLIWFIYKIVFIKEKKEIFKKFVICSTVGGLMSAVVIVPSFFALLKGKATLYKNGLDYLAFSHLGEYTYMTSIGSYSAFSYLDGPALIYSSILVIALTIYYFFNPNVTKKEKLATLIVTIFFYLSFTFNLLNYAWQLFQKPIWWQSRFSFLFSFFAITIAARTLEIAPKVKIKSSKILAIWLIWSICIVIGDILKHGALEETITSTLFYLLLSSILFLTYLFLLNRKKSFYLLAIFVLVELSMNSFNALLCIKNSANFREESSHLKDDIPYTLEKIDDESFYRFDSTSSYTAMDGAFFDFYGIDYFNSARNMSVIDLFKKLGVGVESDCYVYLDTFDPVLYSLLNVKYIYGEGTDYYDLIGDGLYKNRYPLSIGFIGSSEISNLILGDDPYKNREDIIKTLSNMDLDLYKVIDEEELTKDEGVYLYQFESNKKYLLIDPTNVVMTIDDIEYSYKDHPVIESGSKVKLTLAKDKHDDKVVIHLLDLNALESHLEKLSRYTLNAKSHVEGHILKGYIDIEEDGYLFTTIEYENGMKFFVDGTPIEPEIVLGTLVGFKLDAGSHVITVDYIPEGFVIGVLVSSVGLIIFIYIIEFKKNSRT